MPVVGWGYAGRPIGCPSSWRVAWDVNTCKKKKKIPLLSFILNKVFMNHFISICRKVSLRYIDGKNTQKAENYSFSIFVSFMAKSLAISESSSMDEVDELIKQMAQKLNFNFDLMTDDGENIPSNSISLASLVLHY